jgi:hypothetical protein
VKCSLAGVSGYWSSRRSHCPAPVAGTGTWFYDPNSTGRITLKLNAASAVPRSNLPPQGNQPLLHRTGEEIDAVFYTASDLSQEMQLVSSFSELVIRKETGGVPPVSCDGISTVVYCRRR